MMMRSTALLLPLALTALPFLACSSDKNHAEREASPEAPKAIDFNDEAAMKAACIGACTPDPGSKPVDVARAQGGYQFAWMWALEPLGATPFSEGKALATYTYDDNTANLVVPKRIPSATGYGQGGWEPLGDPVPPGQGPAWAARFKGGPFTEYGGGFGQSFRTTTNNVGARSTNPSIQLLEMETANAQPPVEFPDPTAGAYDLRKWEGVAIWVRRGPDGQATMRVGLTERNSAEDLNSQALADAGSHGVVEGKYCKRWRICGCSGGTPCTPAPGTTDDFRCYDPAVDTPTVLDIGDIIRYPHCGPKRCNDANSSTAVADPLFVGKSCNEAIQSDGHSDEFCWNPKTDPNPPAKRERCNNPFSRPITVTMDWQLIKVPFSELRQADEAMVAPEMDLASVKQLVFTYGGGLIDFWVANIGFYRKQ